MAGERFLQRWSRLKAASPVQSPPPALPRVASMPGVAHHSCVPGTLAPHALMPNADAPAMNLGQVNAELADVGSLNATTPTLTDAALLNATSDYAPFMARGVDASVRRLAMKKLFADPHFNLIDGLDMYMADYNLPDPVSPAMLAALTHARSVLPQPEPEDRANPADPAGPTEPADLAEPIGLVDPIELADPAGLNNPGASAQLPSSGANAPAPPPAAPSTPSAAKDSDERTRADQQ